MLDAESFLLGMAAGGGGGGGNPNYVETIEGTLENPWGEVDASDLSAEIVSANASVYMYVDATALGMGVAHLMASPYAETGIINLQAIGASSNASVNWKCVSVGYNADAGTLESSLVLSEDNVTDAYPYASAIATVLTIIHHPLP